MAVVAFTLEELVQLGRDSAGASEDLREQAEALMQLFREARRYNHREIGETMGAADDFMDAHGVEALFTRDGQVVNDAWDSEPGIEYVNVGETWLATILYDYRTHEFRIGSYGDWIQTWEAENRPEEDVCGSCGRVFPVDELEISGDEESHEATCRECMERLREPPPPIWSPAKVESLVAMLRSVEGMPIAVHMIDYDALRLAFSVPYNAPSQVGFFYAQREEEPYSRTWPSVVDAFKRGQPDLYVTSINSRTSPQNFSIERDQFQRLAVAMDSFLERGMERQAKEFLETPPVLWRCSQIDHVVWYEERGIATVEAHVGNPGLVSAMKVWETRSPDVEELIEDGFIKWNNDDSVREYLKSIGICRRD